MDFLVPEETEEATLAKPAVKKPGGTFRSMELWPPMLKNVEKRYKLATPIQRKCIPPIMAGRDVVAMARTGSGKTAAFLLPLIHRLRVKRQTDIRALIISPTRELATQTEKFVKDFTKNTGLRHGIIIGGGSIGHDFDTITKCPDILVATPGRLAHVLVEMKQKLNGVEIVVFDEADRLFEPGFKEMEQVNEICSRLPESKQTLLFSATIPQKLAEFAKAGLKNPLLIRLDVETNLSDTLKSIHLHCNPQDKFAILVHLLKNFVNKDQMTVVFMPTKHHIEYAKMVLSNTQIDCCLVYSSMDPEARKINIDRFSKKVCKVMLVTDIAARGIDIPMLDVVINFNFPFKPKLYIHRVGRVARAGRFGCAISLISHDETPYLHNLHLFFNLPITLASELPADQLVKAQEIKDLPDKVLGTVPQTVLDDENDILKRWHEHDDELNAMVKVCSNAMKPYIKTREPPSAASVKMAKEIHRKSIGIHPIFKMSSQTGLGNDHLDLSEDQGDLLSRIKLFKPKETIFEVGHIKGNRRLEAFEVMKKKREFHEKIANKKAKDNDSSDGEDEAQEGQQAEKHEKKDFEDSKFYIKYQRDDYQREKGLGIDSDLKHATLDLVADDEDGMKRQRSQTVWDRKRKKFVNADQQEGKVKKVKTESGTMISASYNSGLFEKWKKQSKVEQREDSDDKYDDDDDHNRSDNHKGLEKLRSKLKPAKMRWVTKNPEEMLKERNIQEKRENILKLKMQRKSQKKMDDDGPSKGPKGRRGKQNRRSSGGGGGGRKGFGDGPRRGGIQKGARGGGRKSGGSGDFRKDKDGGRASRGGPSHRGMGRGGSRGGGRSSGGPRRGGNARK